MSPLNASVRNAWSTDASTRGGPGILVVDDDPETRRVICEALNHQGFTRLYQAGDGADGLAMYRQHADVVRAMVLDVMMPNLSGAHVLDNLMQINPPGLGVLLVSGHADSLAAVCERYRAAGGRFYLETLPKPFKLPELAARVKRILMQQGGPSALVGSGVLLTPGEVAGSIPKPSMGGGTVGHSLPQPSVGGGEVSFGQAPARANLAAMEKQVARVEMQVAELISTVSALRRQLDDLTRSKAK